MTIGDICPIIREEIITLSKYEIDFYRKNDNTCPMEDFLNSLEYKMRAKMLRLIMLLEQNGNELREPYSKFLSDGIYELRARQGNNTSRALYFFDIEHKIILTNGFVKKTRKTHQKAHIIILVN